MHCAQVLDRIVDAEALSELVAMLDDPDPRVRWHTLHALACDRCKDNSCLPAKAAVLPRAIELLRTDSSQQVRMVACEVIGRWVHTDNEASSALIAARENDPAPSVRKKASWYAPGGTIHKKTAPV
jgi:HEAT repeat protein